MDDFKQINDSFGHPEGDRALIKTAELLTRSFRESDIIARLGGDEFTVLAVHADDDSVSTITKRLAETLSQCNAQADRGSALAWPASTRRAPVRSMNCSREPTRRCTSRSGARRGRSGRLLCVVSPGTSALARFFSYDAFRTTGIFTPDDPGHRLSHNLAPPPSRVDLRNREDTTLRTVSGSPPRAALALLGNDQCATRVSDEAFGSRASHVS